MKDALLWLGFLIAVPLVLWLLAGGLKVHIDETDKKIQECVESGGVMNKYMQCAKWEDLKL